MRPIQKVRLGVLVLLHLVLPLATGQASAQSYTLTGTYQVNAGRYDQGIPGSEFRAWGVMLGSERADRRWSPHLWFQSYETKVVQPGARPDDRGNRSTGWFLSLGPAIEFLGRGPLIGVFLPQLGLTSRGVGDFTGSAGFHLGLRAGVFRPQIFGRLQTLRGPYFWTVGAGVTLEMGRRAPGRRQPF
jgi:hypothetical protein